VPVNPNYHYFNKELTMSNPQPVDSMIYPRYSSIATFFRLPHITDPNELDVAIVGIPFDGSAGYMAGPRYAPREIRARSATIRPHNMQGVNPFEKHRVADYGDLSTTPFSIEETFKRIQAGITHLLDNDVIPVSVGGDHGITLPVLRAIGKKHGPVALIQIDSHPDTHDSQFGHPETHATMLRRGIEENIVIPDKVISIGLRGSLFYANDLQYGYDKGIRVIFPDEYQSRDPLDVRREIHEIIGDAKVYFTLDIDGIDPAFAPGTPVPEVGGLTSANALQITRSLEGLNIVGTDICEVSPPVDNRNQITSVLAAQLIFEMLCVI
jgi:agmatinase